MKTRKMLFAAVVSVVLLAAGGAFAAVNPFVDIPSGHWAYDALAQMSARGILSGYPDGTFKGVQPMTRYEAASTVARVLANVDMNKAGKEDMELLKKLVLEFKDELDNLGVKVNELDSRIAVLESGVGGWKLWGELRFDAKFGNETPSLYTPRPGKNDFHIDRARIWLRKTVDDNVSFTARFGMNTEYNGFTWEQNDDVVLDLAWVDISLPWNWEMKVGKWQVDWSAADQTYADNDSMFSNRIMKGFYFSRPWNTGDFAAYVAHEDNRFGTAGNDEVLEYGARGKMYFSDSVFASANYIMRKYDGNLPGVDYDQSVLWGTLGTAFTPGIDGRFSYYAQSLGKDAANVGLQANGDSPGAWHLSLALDQSKLKFTSLRLEYMKPDENFRAWTDGPFDMFGARVTGLELGRYDNILFVGAEQRWSDKWATFERYVNGEARWKQLASSVPSDDTTNWSLGVRYFYTPALSFELAYDKIENSQAVKEEDDHMVRFRTHVTF